MATNEDDLIAALARVSAREQARAKREFFAAFGRPYDGGSDDDWDAIDKDYVAVDEAINVVRAAK